MFGQSKFLIYFTNKKKPKFSTIENLGVFIRADFFVS